MKGKKGNKEIVPMCPVCGSFDQELAICYKCGVEGCAQCVKVYGEGKWIKDYCGKCAQDLIKFR